MSDQDKRMHEDKYDEEFAPDVPDVADECDCDCGCELPVGQVTLVTAGNEHEVDIYGDLARSNPAYVVNAAFAHGATIVEGKKNGVRIKRGEDTFLIDCAPEDYQLLDGDRVYVAKVHKNG